MTPREFFNAWIGWSEARNENLEAIRNMIYGASRFNAASTAMSKDQARSISNHRFPWEAPKPKKWTPEENKKKIQATLRGWK